MSERRYAVLIAASQFPEEEKLLPLRAPENDVDGLNEVLTSKELGGFTDVAVLKNELSHVVHKKILRALRNADKNDFVLIYYSGHGKLDFSGRLHLATKDTTINDLEATSISPMRIRESVENTCCNKVVLILDCCFSGAVGRIFARGSLDEQFQLVSGGRGTYIMTASTAIQIAQEKEDDQYGLFTKYLIEGIRSGEADRDEDGNVTMDELYTYVHNRMLDEGFQEPMKWDLNVRGELVIARTGKSPREDRRRAIRERLTDLYRQGNLPLRVLTEALALNDKQSSDDSDLQRRQLLNHLLLPEKLQVGDFIGAWYEPSMQGWIPALTKESRALEPGVETEKTEQQRPGEKTEEEAAVRRSAEEEAVARKPEEEAVARKPEEEAAVRRSAGKNNSRTSLLALVGGVLLLVLVVVFALKTRNDSHLPVTPISEPTPTGTQSNSEQNDQGTNSGDTPLSQSTGTSERSSEVQAKLKGAATARQNGKYLDAAQLMREAVEINPDSQELMIKLGDSLREAATQYGFTSPSAHRLRAEAISDYDKANSFSPSGIAFSHKGRVLVELGKWREAIPEFDKAVKSDPAQANEYYFELGDFLTPGLASQWSDERANESIRAFDKAIAAKPNDAEAYVAKGTICMQFAGGFRNYYYKDDKIDFKEPMRSEAIAAFKKYLELDPRGKHSTTATDFLEILGSR